MRGGFAFSALLHLAVLVVIVVGLPNFSRDREIAVPIPVEIVSIDEITRPRPAETPQPEVEQPPEPQEIPEAPEPPARQAAPPPPPPPAPVQEAARAVEAPAPPPAPEPEPEPAPTPPEPEVAPTPEPEKVEETPPPAPQPNRKPRPKRVAEKPPEVKKEPEPNALDNILRNVDKLKQETPQVQQQVAETPRPQPSSRVSSQPLSGTEIDAVKQQIYPCWNPNIGAPNAEELLVEIKIYLNQDGSLRDYNTVSGGLSSDTYLRDAEERAIRAVVRCTPLQRLPPKKYAEWREMTLVFDPREILGR